MPDTLCVITLPKTIMASSFLLIFVAVHVFMMATIRPTTCAKPEIRCRMENVSRCISQRLLCNGVRNCFNGEDELTVNCREYKRRKLFLDTSKHCYIEPPLPPPPPTFRKKSVVQFKIAKKTTLLALKDRF